MQSGPIQHMAILGFLCGLKQIKHHHSWAPLTEGGCIDLKCDLGCSAGLRFAPTSSLCPYEGRRPWAWKRERQEGASWLLLRMVWKRKTSGHLLRHGQTWKTLCCDGQTLGLHSFEGPEESDSKTENTAVVASFTRAFDCLPSLDPSCFRRQTTHGKHSEFKAATVTCPLPHSHPCTSTLNLEFQLTNYSFIS